MRLCCPWGWLEYFWCKIFHKTNSEPLPHNGFVLKCQTCSKWHIRRD